MTFKLITDHIHLMVNTMKQTGITAQYSRIFELVYLPCVFASWAESLWPQLLQNLAPFSKILWPQFGHFIFRELYKRQNYFLCSCSTVKRFPFAFSFASRGLMISTATITRSVVLWTDLPNKLTFKFFVTIIKTSLQ